MKLGDALGGMFKTYFKKPLLFSGIYVLVNLVMLVLNILLFGGMYTSMMTGDMAQSLAFFSVTMIIFFVIFFIVGIVVEAITLGGLIKATASVLENKKITIIEAIKYAFSRVWDYIKLLFRVIWYTGVWLFILIPGAFAIINTLLVSGLGNAQLIGADDTPSMLAESTGMTVGSYAGSAFGILNMLLGLAAIVIFVIVIIRGVKAVFAFYSLFDSEKTTPKAALEESIKLSKGNWWRILGYAIILGLIFAVIDYVFQGFILMPILNSMSNYTTVLYTQVIITFIYTAIIMPMPIIYFYIFYKGLQKEK